MLAFFEGDVVLLQVLPVAFLQGASVGYEHVVSPLHSQYRCANAAFTTTEYDHFLRHSYSVPPVHGLWGSSKAWILLHHNFFSSTYGSTVAPALAMQDWFFIHEFIVRLPHRPTAILS